MNFLSMLIRLLSVPITIIGIFMCVILIEFPIIILAREMNLFADKIDEYSYKNIQ